MTRKNTYQQGYVSPPRKLKDGRAAREIKYRLRTGEGGWRQKSETLYNVGIREARAIVNQRIREASARPLQAEELTFTAFVENYWRPYLDRRGAKPSTRHGYESNLKNHILPRLGSLLLADIAPIHIEELLQAKSGMAAKTLRNIIAVAESIFSQALDLGLIVGTPIKKRHKPVVRRAEKQVWSGANIRAILDALPDAYRTVFCCVALTGVRLGELLALRWQDIDLLNRKIRIAHSLHRGQLVSPKTEGSARVIPVGERLSQLLLAHRKAASCTTPDSFVFCKADGSPLHPDILRRDVLYPTLDRLGIARLPRQSGFHAFRHSAGSFVNAETGNLKLAQRLLGHSNLNTTADIYTHTSAEAEREAAEAVERAVFGDLFEIVRNPSNKTDSAPVN